MGESFKTFARFFIDLISWLLQNYRDNRTLNRKVIYMSKINVKVCLGTTCFVMGSSNLQELIETVPAKYGEQVEVFGVPCLGFCNVDWEYSRAPYVKVDDEVIHEATVEKVLSVIERKLENE